MLLQVLIRAMKNAVSCLCVEKKPITFGTTNSDKLFIIHDQHKIAGSKIIVYALYAVFSNPCLWLNLINAFQNGTFQWNTDKDKIVHTAIILIQISKYLRMKVFAEEVHHVTQELMD